MPSAPLPGNLSPDTAKSGHEYSDHKRTLSGFSPLLNWCLLEPIAGERICVCGGSWSASSWPGGKCF